jgi:hypothetical protein
MYQLTLIGQLETSRSRPGQEEFTVRALSSRHADEGSPCVLSERQDDPQACQVGSRGLRAAACALLRYVLPRPAGDAVTPATSRVAS